jgi:hypothetical protein
MQAQHLASEVGTEVSIDVFHEKQLGRQSVFGTLHQIQDAGIDISISTVGFGKDDPYLINLVDAVGKEFKNNVPIFVSSIAAVGRARDWDMSKQTDNVASSERKLAMDLNGCKYATWPVVTFDGNVVACCNQYVVDGPHPSHLIVGNIKDNDWEYVRRKLLDDAVLRAIRITGPVHIAKRFDSLDSCSGYCDTCMKLSGIENLSEKIKPWIETDGMKLIEKYIQYFHYNNPLFNLPQFSELLYFGSATVKHDENG